MAVTTMTLLQLAQAFAKKVGIAPPAAIIGSTDVNALQILECLNDEVKEHCNSDYDFPNLKVDAAFSYTPGDPWEALELYNDDDVPGFRSMVPRTLWNTTIKLEVVGPVDDPTWAAMTTMAVSATQDAYRVRGSWLQIYNAGTTLQEYRFTYITRFGVLNTSAELQEEFLDDTDVTLLASRLLLKGLEWRWLQKKGLPFAKEADQYEKLLESEASRQPIPNAIRMDGCGPKAQPAIFIPAGNWPLP